MGAVVEKDSDCVVRQLVTKAILVGVVHPFSHPLETAVQAFFWNVIGCKNKINIKNLELNLAHLWDNVKTWAAEIDVKGINTYLLACSPDSLGVLWQQCLLQYPSCYPPSLPSKQSQKGPLAFTFQHPLTSSSQRKQPLENHDTVNKGHDKHSNQAKHTFTAAAAASQRASDNHADGVTDLLLVASVLGSNNWLSSIRYWWLTVLKRQWENGSITDKRDRVSLSSDRKFE